jgi:pimeloyl-ACP methyl ester carboxylesterase
MELHRILHLRRMAHLSSAGYRVVAPDQVGFCKSTEPAHYQYTFQQLSENTRALLDSIGVKNAIVSSWCW